MNKFESKYQNTARVMDEALLELIGEKDFKFISVKELCKKAGVNRSTFYLHYETMNDLLDECVEMAHKDFYDAMRKPLGDVEPDINNCSLEDLNFITPKYLTPYLNYIKEHKKLFKVASENSDIMKSDLEFQRMMNKIFVPILKRFGVDEMMFPYIMCFHISGLNSIVNEWVERDCKESVEEVISAIQWCVKTIENH